MPEPLNTIFVENEFADLIKWAKAADALLSHYRLALEEIAARDVSEDAMFCVIIAREALGE